MRIYTRRGDDGRTGLRGGTRVSKTDARVEACGACDELNAALGLAVVAADSPDTLELLRSAQSAIFCIGADIAASGSSCETTLAEDAVERMEQAIDRLEARMPPLTNFILPGGTEAAARLHMARAVCRRAERAVVALAQQFPVHPRDLAYVNRLSDLLFVLARAANRSQGVDDPVWRGPTSKDG